MKFSQVIVLAATPTFVLTYNLFGSRSTATINVQPAVTNWASGFNANELLDSKYRKPEIYTKAMLELKRLEEEPICHRIAAQSLMNNCRGLENIGEKEDYQLNSFGLQRHHVESFAASLAICDMERASFTIPDACTPFTGSALRYYIIHASGKLQVSPEHVLVCLQALGQDPSQWNTWLSYRDKALLFCRAARLDIDKDQSILLHKKLTQIMTEFTDGLHDDLRNMRQNLAHHTQATDSYFEKVINHAENWKAKVQDSFEAISDDAKDVSAAMKSVMSSSGDVYRMMRNLVNTMIHSNAEMAAEHEQAIAVTTNTFQSRMRRINELAQTTQQDLGTMKDVVGALLEMVVSISERQKALEETSQVTLSAMINATELLQSHNRKLNQASSTASGIHENLERAAATAMVFNSQGSFGDWALRALVPLSTLIVGSFRATPTLAQNMGLLSGGFLLAESINTVRHWGWMWTLCGSYFTFSTSRDGPSSATQQPREWVVSSLELTPIDVSATREIEPRPHVDMT